MLLEALLLLRGWRGGYISKFPIFFSYIGLILVQSLFLYFAVHLYPTTYAFWFWLLELLDVLAGCAVTLEIYRIGLAELPGAKKVARNALLFVFCLTIGRVLLTTQEGLPNWSTMMTIQLERDMRFVQIAAILTLLVLLLYYAVSIGRNLGGILLGYGFFLGANILNLTLMQRYGARVQSIASYIESLSYLSVLCLWTICLWSYCPHSLGRFGHRKKYSYGDLYAETQDRLGQARKSIKDAWHLP